MHYGGPSRALTSLADLYELHIYEYAKALPLYERALEILERALGSNHPEVAETLNDIALVHNNQGVLFFGH